MSRESLVFALSGVLFGVIIGWILGSQQASPSRAVTRETSPSSTQATQPGAAPAQRPALDEAQVRALAAIAEREPANAAARAQLGNLYFDAERYQEAIRWYEEALKLTPRDVNVSTDLGVSYYYTNQPDRALAQFDYSLNMDPRHAKTLLNVGVVRAFGKQDLQGAAAAWEQVVRLTPGSPEGQAARRALDSMKAAHPEAGSPGQPATGATGKS